MVYLFSAYAFLALPTTRSRLSAKIFLPLLVFFLALLVPCFSGAPLYPHLLGLLRYLSFALIAAAVALDPDPRTVPRFIRFVFCLAVLEAMFLLIRFRTSANFGGYLTGNPNYSALLIGAGLCAVPLLLPRSRDAVRWGLIAATFVLVFAFGLTRSRSAFLGLSAAAFFLVPPRRVMMGLLAAAGVFSVHWLFQPEGALNLLRVNPADAASFGRLAIWKTSLIAMGHQWSGFGLGSFETAYLAFQQPVDDLFRYSRFTMFAHNDFLQIGVEGGWIALASALWLLAVILRPRPANGDSASRWGIAVATLTLVSALFFFSTYLEINGLVFAGALAILIRLAPNNADSFFVPRTWLGFILGAGAFFLIAAAGADQLALRGKKEQALRVMPLRADLWYQRGLDTLQSMNPRSDSQLYTSARLIRESLRWNQRDAFAWQRLALVLSNVRDPNVLEIDAAFARARVLAPNHVPFYMQEGAYRLTINQPEAAIPLFRRAAELEPIAPIPCAALAHALEKMGRPAEAKQAMNEAVKRDKTWRPVLARIDGWGPYTTALFGPRQADFSSSR